MNKVLRKRISSLLKTNPYPNVPEAVIANHLALAGSTSLFDVRRELGLMRDEGLVEQSDLQLGHWRLTSPGDRATSPFSDKVMHYFLSNWIAIAAFMFSAPTAIISFVHLVRDFFK